MKNCPNCKSEVPKEYDICWNCNYDFINKKIVQIKILQDDKKEYRSINCLRCDVPLKFKGAFRFHEGTKWGILGDLGHLFTNRESFELYICPECNKVEFFAPFI